MKQKTYYIGENYIKEFTVSNEMVEGFANYTGDKNPIHLDESYASNTIFKKRIAHGFLVGSFISAILGNDFPGKGTIYLSQTLVFRAPVYISETISVKVEITGFPHDKQIQLKTVCSNEQNKVVLEGEAVVLPPLGSILNL